MPSNCLKNTLHPKGAVCVDDSNCLHENQRFDSLFSSKFRVLLWSAAYGWQSLYQPIAGVIATEAVFYLGFELGTIQGGRLLKSQKFNLKISKLRLDPRGGGR